MKINKLDDVIKECLIAFENKTKTNCDFNQDYGLINCAYYRDGQCLYNSGNPIPEISLSKRYY